MTKELSFSVEEDNAPTVTMKFILHFVK
uniref:Uncharacterized protein n=1 Tax=Anguilla anguilla TaxID=7936 RepID=A0A0E9WFV5_ANGAN